MERNYSIDLIKFFAIFSVILIHTRPFYGDAQLIINIIARFSVPFFFATAGYLFGQKIIGYNNPNIYVKRYLTKILKIYVSWVIFYIIYDLVMFLLEGYINPLLDLKMELINYFGNYNFFEMVYSGIFIGAYHLWFLPALIWSIIILYVCYRIKIIRVLLFSSFMLNLVGLFGQSYSIFIDIPINTRDTLFFGIFYTTLGFYFTFDNKLINLIKTKKVNFYLPGIIIAFFILQLLEGLYLINVDNEAGIANNYYFSTIFISISLMIFIINRHQFGKGILITEVGGNALGVYVIHVFYIRIFDTGLQLFNLKNITDTVGWSIFAPLAVLIISYLSYELIQYLKKILLKGKKLRIYSHGA